MSEVPSWFYEQAGVVPIRVGDDGLQVLLITSKKGRWIFPKGVIERHQTARQAAEAEAWEEAGVRGELLPDVVGTYSYAKWGGVCTVTVFALRVTEVVDEWPESDWRKRRWLPATEAELTVETDDLRRMIRDATRAVAE